MNRQPYLSGLAETSGRGWRWWAGSVMVAGKKETTLTAISTTEEKSHLRQPHKWLFALPEERLVERLNIELVT
ncbi:MAG: hypothetical protein WBW48_19795 [Anaerolineae bacterium]